MIKFKTVLFAISALSIIQVPALPQAHGAGGSCTKKIVDRCRSNGQAAGATDATAPGSLYNSAATGAAEAGAAGARVGAAAQQCQDSAAECAKCPKEEQEQCKQQVGAAAGTMSEQSASLGDASAAMAAVAGLAAGLLPMLMQKKDEDKKENTGALLPSGQLDCSKNDAFMYQACNDLLSASCKTAMSDPRCVTFSNRYCAGAANGVTPPGAGRVAVSVPGEGQGSAYCNTVAAYNYCAPGGRDNCPSCLQLQQESSPACVQNPALCIAQNSAAELAKAKASCPGDPIYLNPQFGSSGGAVSGAPVTVPVAGVPVGTSPGFTPNPNLPAPVIMSVKGAASSGSADLGREAYKQNAAAGSRFAAASVGGGANAAGAHTAGVDRMAASTNSTGPASDVNGPFAPSLFATSTQVIRSRCAAGRFLNCP